MKNWLLAALVLLPIAVVGSMAYNDGYASGYREGLEHGVAMFECEHDDRRSCAFSPGVVGVQTCRIVGHTWGRCEPDPSYRVTTAKPEKAGD